MEEVKKAVQSAVKELFNIDIGPELSRPDEQLGDYSTNIAMQLAKKLGKNPQEIAEALASKLQSLQIAKAVVAAPGFINIKLSDEYLAKQAFEQKLSKPYAGKTVVCEYSDPNPFKILHAGHLYTSVVGDAIANLFEAAGAEVHKVNYGGDIGLHVAKTIWAILQKLGGEDPSKLSQIPQDERDEWLGEVYVQGSSEYDQDEQARSEITELNKRLYQIVADDDHKSPLAQIYWTCREWSYNYFDAFYARIGTKFERIYKESEVVDLGLKTVNEQLVKGVFAKSDGAIIFDGEKLGLHTRVFINSQGIPTYETKEVGLILTKNRDYQFDKSIVITGNEQQQYMEVVLKAVEQFAPELVQASTHLTHGLVKLKGGEKMSSRKGNILRAADVLDAASAANQKATGKQDNDVELGAVKYTFIKQRTGGDIIYDPEESVSLQGNSGPYVQYAHARAKSILSKAAGASGPSFHNLEPGERSLVRKIGEYPEVVGKAVQELMPHYICTYLYELAQTFNRFYENNRVLDDPREQFRLQLVSAYAQVLKNGLSLLNIAAPEKM